MRHDLPPPAATTRRARQMWEGRYRFLTHAFGGGVSVRGQQKPCDSVTPVRGAAVRGQLRFWWRACNPRRCTTTDELRKQEDAIWGTTDQASSVVIEIVRQPATWRPVQVYGYEDGRFRMRPGMREIAYGAFPLQPSREAQRHHEPPGVLTDFGSEEVIVGIELPRHLEEDVASALWAWETFGGLGGRVRRGFGAIERQAPPGAASDPPLAPASRTPAPPPPAGVAAVRAALARYAGHPRIPGVPSLAGSRFAVSPRVEPTALAAWKTGLRVLQDIRQGVDEGRNPASGLRPNVPAGRSRWPEPDEIRRLTGQRATLHARPKVSVERFPRAVFGMPIVFHFSTPGDPAGDRLELTPAGFERMASPLIVRPLADGGGYRAAALVLTADVPACQLIWETRGKSAPFPVLHRLDAAEAAAIPALRRPGAAPFTDPLALYLHQLQRQHERPGQHRRRPPGTGPRR